MVFVRPPLGQQRAARPTWQSILGAADDQDGREIALLAATLRQIGRDWAAVVVVPLALLALFLSFGSFSASIRSVPFMASFGVWILSDLVIASANQFKRFDSIVPNRRLAIMAGLIFLSSMSFRICAALSLGEQATPLLVSTLAPALLALAVLGRLRALGLALAVGSCLGLLVVIPDIRLAMPYLALLLGIVVMLAREYWARVRAVAAEQAAEGALSGEQAKALLEEFERSGRGWFWETDRTGNITYISETLAAKFERRAVELMGTPFSSLLAASGTGTDRDNQRTLGFHFSARTSFSDMAVRAAVDEEERWWSISGRPVTTEFGQFLGFRGNGSDLTEMRRSQAEVARLASVDSLTRPRQPAADDARARTGADHAARAGRRLRAAPARPRPVQGSQRHDGPSGRRRAAAAGRPAAAAPRGHQGQGRPHRWRRIQGSCCPAWSR